MTVNYSPAFIHLGEVRQGSPPGWMQAPHPLLAWYRWLKELTPHRREGENFKGGGGGSGYGEEEKGGTGGGLRAASPIHIAGCKSPLHARR